MISDAQLLSHTKAESTETAYLRTLEQAAVAAIQKKTGRYFGAVAALTEYHDKYPGEPIVLNNTPISLTTFKSWNGSAFATVDSTSYYLKGASIIRTSAATWPPLSLPTRYEIVYSAGYTAVGDVWPAPMDIQQAVLLLVGNWFENREAVVVGDGATPELPLSVTWILEPHMRIAV